MITKEELQALYRLGFNNGIDAVEDIRMQHIKAEYEEWWLGGLTGHHYVAPDMVQRKAEVAGIIDAMLAKGGGND